MLIGGAPMGSVELGGLAALNQTVEDWILANPFRLWIEGVDRSGEFRVDTFIQEQTLGERGTLQFEMRNPTPDPEEGDEVALWFGREQLFGGTIEEIERTHDHTHRYRGFKITCVDWFRMGERKRARLTYGVIGTTAALAAVHAVYLADEGLLVGQIDGGPDLTKLDADYVNAAQVLRDIAEAAALALWYDPDRRLQARKTTNLLPGVSLSDGVLEAFTKRTQRDQYRNVETVKVTGVGGNFVFITRRNEEEIETRAAEDGGTGEYQGYDEISHPTSDATADLQLLGHAYAFVKLRILGEYDVRANGRTRLYGLRMGDLCPIVSAAYGVSGSWIIERLRRTARFGRHLISEFDAVLSNIYALEKSSLLKIADAGRAAIYFDITQSANQVEFTTSQSWVVPGTGDVDLQIDVYGAGGGGGAAKVWASGACTGGDQTCLAGAGGNGGKAVTLITLPAGTTLTITVGSAGIVGTGQATFLTDTATAVSDTTAGGNGGNSKCENGATLLAQGNGGAGGDPATNDANIDQCDKTGAAGTPGSGVGDVVTVGGGASGGVGGTHIYQRSLSAPTAGSGGRVVIRY